MAPKPIFVLTHPRSCSTAFERVFMTRDDLNCQHEPFGDAFYYGPERLGPRYDKDEKTRLESGFSESTFSTILENFEAEKEKGKLLFIKDMAYYLCPSEDASPSIALSLSKKKRGVGTVNGHSNGTLSDITNGATTNADALESVHEPRNPSVIPTKTLGEFQFAFLIRHPRYSIPSFFRCTVPPLDKQTGFYDFIPSEAGYKELRRMFDYLLSMGQVGPRIGHDENGHESDENGAHGHQVEGHQNGGEKALKPPPKKVEVCLVDADDLLDHPAAVISAFCKSVGLEYDESMLKWDTEEDKKHAEEAFEKWKGFHEDAIDSDCLRPRAHRKQPKSDDEEDAEWREKYGEEAARVIRETVDANVADYEYLKHYALKF